MPPIKKTPALRVSVSPLGPITRYLGSSLALADNLINLQKGHSSDASVDVGANARPTVGPGLAGHVRDVVNLRWWDLADDDDQTRMAGYTVEPRRVALSNVLYGETKINPPEGALGLVWDTSGDTRDAWQTCLPDREPVATALKFTLCAAGARAHAFTKLPLPANQHWGFEIQMLGVAPDSDPWLMLRWGQEYCTYWRPGQEMVLGRAKRQGGPVVSKAGALAAAGWLTSIGTGVMRRLIDGTPITVPVAGSSDLYAIQPMRRKGFAGLWDYQLTKGDVVQVGERLVVDGDSDDNRVVWTDRVRNSKDPGGDEGEGIVRPINIPQAPLHVEGSGCSFVIRVHEVAYSDGTEGPDPRRPNIGRMYQPTVVGGSFRRRFFVTRNLAATGYASGYNPKNTGKATARDYQPVGNVTIEDAEKGVQHYKCEVRANAQKVKTAAVDWRSDLLQYDHGKAMRGETTELVHAVTVDAPATFRQVTSDDPINLRPAMSGATEICADPELQSGPMWTLNGDRTVLPDLPSPIGGGSLGNDWKLYVADYHKTRIEVAWIYDDGVQRAFAGPNSPASTWLSRMDGYILGEDRESPSYNDRTFSLHVRDPICLLQDPAGQIDEKYAALDFLWLKRQREYPNTIPQVFGADAVYYMLKTEFGQAEADRLQVYYPNWSGKWVDAPVGGGIKYNYDGTGRHASPSELLGQWDLYMYKAFCEPPSGGGFVWPAPYGGWLYDWIRSMCAVDFASFWYGPDMDDPTQLAPCYGNYFAYVYGRGTTTLSDAWYAPGDENFFLTGYAQGTMPMVDYNRFVVWGRSPAGETLGGVMPALPAFSATETINNSPIPEQNAARTWQRTLLLQGTHYWLPKLAARVAANAAHFQRGTNIRRFAPRHRGVEWLRWGDKIHLEAGGPESDPDIETRDEAGNLLTFRVMRLTSTWLLGEKPSWNTVTNIADMWRPTSAPRVR